MSRAPSQCGPPSSDQRYTHQVRQVSYPGYHSVPASSNQNYPTQELPRFLYPDNQGYDPTVATRPPGSQRSWQGNQQSSDADRNFNVYGHYGSTDPRLQYGLQRTCPVSFQQHAPGSAEYYSYQSFYQDAYNSLVSYGRGSVGSGGWSNDVDSQHSGSSAAFTSPVNSDHSMASFPGNCIMTNPQSQQSQRQRPSDCSAIMGIDNILQRPLTPPPAPRRQPQPQPEQQTKASAQASTQTPSRPRYHLHIRQQPIAARACGAGDRDRRPVDPPPIVQMLLTDFNPSDVDILQDPRFTVGCLLSPITPTALASSERNTESTWESRASGISRSEDDSGILPGQSTPLLSGKAFVSPFYVDADPDPATAPAHPSGYNTNADLNRKTRPQPDENAKIPSTFFIFSDLSVRTAGLYRFQFRLMNWGSVEDTGQSMPILAEAWSEPFRVYPAKDFPGMRDSSPLAEGLKEMGFVELKTRGKGKGKGRRR